MKNVVVIFILSLILLSFQVYSEDEKLVERTVCVLDPVNMSEIAGQFGFIGSLVSDTVSIMLNEAGYRVIDGSVWREKAEKEKFAGDKLLNKNAVLKFAQLLGADVVLNGVFRVEGEEIIIGVRAYDIFTGRIAVAVLKTGPAGVGIYDTIDEVSGYIAKRIREKLKPLPASVITVQREKVKIEKKIVEKVVSIGRDVSVTCLSADEDAEILLGGAKHVAAIKKGIAKINAKANTVLELTIRKPGFYDKRESFKIGDKDISIKFGKLYRRTHWDVSAYAVSNLPIGAGGSIRFHFFPDVFTGALTGGIYYIPNTYYFWDKDFKLSQFMLLGRLNSFIGFYPLQLFTPKDFPFRFSVNLGASLNYYYIFKSDFPGFLLFGPYTGIAVEYNMSANAFYIEVSVYPGTTSFLDFSGKDMAFWSIKAGYLWKLK